MPIGPDRATTSLKRSGTERSGAVVDVVIDRHGELLRRGAVLVDRQDIGETPRLLVALTQQVVDGHVPPRVESR